MDTEIWMDVEGYNWIYKISNLGRSKSNKFWKERILRLWISCWYKNLKFTNKWKWKPYKVHRLVAQAFIENPDNLPCINHKNWIKTDNRVENLEWCTHSENMFHAFKLWLNKISINNIFKKNHPSKWKFWKDNKKSKKINQYSLERKFIKTWSCLKEVQIELWIHNISACCRWVQKTAGWFIWKFF